MQQCVSVTDTSDLLLSRWISASRWARAWQATRYSVTKSVRNLAWSWSADERRCFKETSSVSISLHRCSSCKQRSRLLVLATVQSIKNTVKLAWVDSTGTWSWVSTYSCFILYTVSKRVQTNDVHLSGFHLERFDCIAMPRNPDSQGIHRQTLQHSQNPRYSTKQQRSTSAATFATCCINHSNQSGSSPTPKLAGLLTSLQDFSPLLSPHSSDWQWCKHRWHGMKKGFCRWMCKEWNQSYSGHFWKTTLTLQSWGSHGIISKHLH